MRITSLHDLRQAARQRRIEKGLSQATAAGLIGHSRKWLSDFERGKTDPPAGMVIDLLVLLGIPIETREPTPDTGDDGYVEIDLDEGL